MMPQPGFSWLPPGVLACRHVARPPVPAYPESFFQTRLVLLPQFLCVFKFHDIIHDLFRIGCGSENLTRIIPKNFYPTLDVGGMVINTLADAKFTGNHHTADFGPQFLFSIGNGTERPEFTVQMRFMASPVRKFMKGCRIIPFLTRKLFFSGR